MHGFAIAHAFPEAAKGAAFAEFEPVGVLAIVHGLRAKHADGWFLGHGGDFLADTSHTSETSTT